MKYRFLDEGKTVYDFLTDSYIKCPQCGKFAILKSLPDAQNNYAKRTIVCNNCGFIAAYQYRYGVERNNYSLWLQARCCGEIIWAYNLDHLNYIENFVRAELRQNRKTKFGWQNKSMVSRLPKWIKDARNRAEILKCIQKMKKTIPGL